MNVDLYTKAMLTVIAGCLLWMCVTGVTPGVSAQAKPTPQAQARPAQPQPVMLVDGNGTPLVGAEGLRVTLGPQALPVTLAGTQAVPVVVTNPTLPVAVQAIQRGGAWDYLEVRVLREPPTLMPTP